MRSHRADPDTYPTARIRGVSTRCISGSYGVPSVGGATNCMASRCEPAAQRKQTSEEGDVGTRNMSDTGTNAIAFI
jgi:hypothetical protein